MILNSFFHLLVALDSLVSSANFRNISFHSLFQALTKILNGLDLPEVLSSSYAPVLWQVHIYMLYSDV